MFSNRILLNLQQIEAINWKNLNRPETALVNLPDLEAVPASSELEKLLSADFLSQEPCYDAQGNLYNNSFYDVLKTKIKAADRENMPSPYAVAVTNSFLRRFPTMAGNYRLGEADELDRFAVTLLKLGEPVLVYCQDQDGIWSFVRSTQCYGWMLTAHLAWEPDAFRWRQYCQDREQLIVADSRCELDFIDFDGIAQKQLLLMGTRLPLYDATRETFVAGLPRKDKRGNLAMLQLLLRRDGSLMPGTLPLSAQNIISQAKKMLGEPYGWGGSGYYRDCTSLLSDIFSVFGLQLPRNSSQQIQMHGVEQCPVDPAQKFQFFAALSPGSILYFPGHGMLYLGQQEDQLEILHSVYAIGLPAADRLIPHKIKRVVQGTLQQQRVSGESFFDAVTNCWAPEHQKQFL